jgi:hypothetical protein
MTPATSTTPSLTTFASIARIGDVVITGEAIRTLRVA